MSELTVTIAQIDFALGDIATNTTKILAAVEEAKITAQPDLVVFPELTLTGYPPEDLLLRPGLHRQVKRGLAILCRKIQGVDVVVGYPEQTDEGIYNAACLIRQGEIIANYRKQCLPNYSVFDEKRYFIPGNAPCIFSCKAIKIGLVICEDLWTDDPQGPMPQAKEAGAEVIVTINASPFHVDKDKERDRMLLQRIKENSLPVLYAHWADAQDDLVFDGGSLALNAQGEICQQAKFFAPELLPVKITKNNNTLSLEKRPCAPRLDPLAQAYQALLLGLRRYVVKNGFSSIVLGLSGGVDSALTLVIAADAIGPENLSAILLPSRYTSQDSLDHALALAQNLNVQTETFSIEPIFKACLTTLKPRFADQPADVTEENLQARVRGLLLMALSNKFHHLLLTTGNKSEMAVGYATLYGDMCGGFSVLKDVPKTLVYRLCEYRNRQSPVIPEAIITKAPTAELAPGQTDQDSLPSYDELDEILKMTVEDDKDIDEIVAAGFDRRVVEDVLHRVNRNEYKRYQSPPGIRISKRAFGKDRRYPINSGFCLHDLAE